MDPSPQPVQQQPTITPNAPLQASPPSGNKKALWLIIILVVIAALGVGGYMWWQQMQQKPAAETRTVKIGVIGPFTGDAANYGEVMRHGAEMAQRDFNREGLKIELVERDTQCDAQKAAAGAEELVKEGVIAIIGEVCSAATLGALPVANTNKVLLMSPSSSSPDLTIADDFFYRTYPTDTYQAVVTAELMYKKGIRKIAIVHSDEAYGAGLAKVTVDDFTKVGGTVSANVAINKTSTDFKAKLQEAKQTNPDALYIATNGIAAGAAIVVQAREIGLNVPIYAADALKDASFLTDVGASGNDMTLVTVTPGNRSFLDAYKAAYGTEPANATGAQSYDAFMILAQIIADGAKTGEDIRKALATATLEGKSGSIKSDAAGDLLGGGYLIYTIKDKQFVLVEE